MMLPFDVRALGAAGVAEVGRLSDAQLGGLAPSTIPEGSWWAAAEGTDPVGASASDAGTEPRPSRLHLGLVRHVLHTATTVVTWEFRDPEGAASDPPRRGGFVVADDMAVLAVQRDGLHEVRVTDLGVAAVVLTMGLDPLDLARHRLRRSRAASRTVAAADVEDAVPPPDRQRSTIRLVAVGTGPTSCETVVTVIGTDQGITAWRALPSGGVRTAALDRDGVIAAAVALLTTAGEQAVPA